MKPEKQPVVEEAANHVYSAILQLVTFSVRSHIYLRVNEPMIRSVFTRVGSNVRRPHRRADRRIL